MIDFSDKLDNAKDDLKKEFRLFDTNNDGFIDKKELKVILQKILPKFQLPDEEIQRMISNVDKNNDGKIDYNGIENHLFFFISTSLFYRIYGIYLSSIIINTINHQLTNSYKHLEIFSLQTNLREYFKQESFLFLFVY